MFWAHGNRDVSSDIDISNITVPIVKIIQGKSSYFQLVSMTTSFRTHDHILVLINLLFLFYLYIFLFLRLECSFHLKAFADTVQGVGRYAIGSVTHRQTLERPILLLKGDRMESVGILLGKRSGIKNSRNGTGKNSSLSFYFSRRSDPDQIRSVAHVVGTSANVPHWILTI
jgi:hypothetical protein